MKTLKLLFFLFIIAFATTEINAQTNFSTKWVKAKGIEINQNNLTQKNKNSKGRYFGTISLNLLPEKQDGWIETIIQEKNTTRMIGLSEYGSKINPNTVDFGILLNGKGQLQVYEKGRNKPLHEENYQIGDTIKIERKNDNIHYIKNTTTLYTSKNKSTSELIIDISMKNQGATLHNVLASFSVPKNSNDTIIYNPDTNPQLENWKIYNTRGRVFQERTYLNKKKTGLWKTYHLNGKLKELIEYKEDEAIGVKQEFSNIGLLINHLNLQFANDTIIETISNTPKIEYLTIYDEKGRLKHTGHLHESKKTGIWREFYNDNQVRSITTYHLGKKNGSFFIFDSHGGIIDEGNYQEDKLEGKRCKYKLHGERNRSKMNYKPALIEYYKNGKLNGVFQNFYANGILQESSTYQNGTKNGTSLWYHKTGELLSEFQYKNGVLSGSSKSYYHNSQIKVESNYLVSKLEGDYKEYHDNGTMKLEGQYSKGKKDGIWQYYDVNGEKSKKEWYENGKLIKDR